MWLLFSLLVFYLTSVYPQGAPPAEEPAEPVYTVMIISSPMICEDDVSPLLFKDNRVIADIHNETSSYMAGDITLTEEIAKVETAELKVIKEENGQSKMMMTQCIIPWKEFENLEGDYQFILRYLEPPGGSCPFEPGVLVINNLVIEMPPDMMKQSNEGCYAASINLYSGACDDKDRVFLGCVYLRFCVEPV